MQCFLFGSYKKYNLLSQLSDQNFQACFQALNLGKFFALSKYSPVTLHYSLATAILNETPGFKNHILSYELSH